MNAADLLDDLDAVDRGNQRLGRICTVARLRVLTDPEVMAKIEAKIAEGASAAGRTEYYRNLERVLAKHGIVAPATGLHRHAKGGCICER